MICPDNLDFTMVMGGSFVESLQWWNIDYNQPHDLTNCKIIMLISNKVPKKQEVNTTPSLSVTINSIQEHKRYLELERLKSQDISIKEYEEFIVQLSTDNGKIIVDDPLTGRFTLYMTHKDTLRLKELNVNYGTYDLLIIKSDFHYYPLKGKVFYTDPVNYPEGISIYNNPCSSDDFINGGYRL